MKIPISDWRPTERQIKLKSPKISKLDFNTLNELSQKVISGIKKEDKNILVDVRASVSESVGEIETSVGFKNKEEVNSFTFSASGELVSEGDILQIGDLHFWRDFTFDENKFIKELVEKFHWSKKVVNANSGKYTLMLAPDVLAEILDFVINSLSAQSLYKKVSKFEGKLNQKVADSRFNLLDDPTIDYASHSTLYDDEGFLAETLPLIENGVLKNFYNNLKTAEKLKAKPVGRGFGIPATPSTTNLIIKEGDKTKAQIIKGIKKGILVESVIGGGQDSPYAGDFTLNIHLGFLIENGEIVGRVKNLLFSGNIFEILLNNLGEIASDTQWLGGSAQIPYVSLENINVTGSK